MRRLASILLFALSAWGLTPGAGADESPTFTYIQMSDGVQIAVAIGYPQGFDPDAPGGWPAIFMMDGYEGAALPIVRDYGPYVTVHASIRGTGCSGGRFDLFDHRHARDGYEIIEDWIAKQPWSNGRVGMVGHSYYGITGFLVAAENPPSLKATALSGLIDDLYRGIAYPGGVPNAGFPFIWTGAFRPLISEIGNASLYVQRAAATDPVCAANIATRPPPNPLDDPLLQGLSSRTDDSWWRSRSAIERVGGVRAAMHITHQYQDEQSGPRGGPVLWEHLPPDVPKRLVLTNGLHNTAHMPAAQADQNAWLRCWLIEDASGCGDVTDPSQRVRIHFETSGAVQTPATNEPLVAADFPLPGTDWRRVVLPGDEARSYSSSPAGRQSWVNPITAIGPNPVLAAAAGVYGPITASGGPDEVSYEIAFGKETAIAGPVVVSLLLSSTAVDTDVFVRLIDVDEDGNESHLQKGLLRASHRSVDHHRSDLTEAGEVYRPYRPHTNAELLVPGEVYALDVEVFAVGHVFRPGHRLVVKVHAPPAWDSWDAYAGGQPPALNTVHPGSSILLPVLDTLPPLSERRPCGSQVGVRCVHPAA